MATPKKPSINYTARDFNSLKSALLDFCKRYYADSHKDFSEGSFGSQTLDLVSYVGDVLSFYLDYAANESFINSAIEKNNLIRLGRALGYKFSGTPTSSGLVALYVSVPAKSVGSGPDMAYVPMLLRGSEFSSDGGNSFILSENVDLSDSSNEIIVASTSDATGLPLTFAIKAYGIVISGEVVSETIEVGDYTKFLKIPLNSDKVTEIISVVDSEGREYFEVEFLSQNVVYRSILNRNVDRLTAPYICKPIIVPRRFVVETEENKTYLQFGWGTDEDRTLSNIVEPSNVVLQRFAKDYYTDASFDPTVLSLTDKFGVVPSNTTLTIVYRQNSVENVNAAVGSVNRVVNPLFEFDEVTTLDPNTVNTVVGSLEVSNEDPIVGDVTEPSSDEIRTRIYDVFASQNRCVTAEDYRAAIYSMPARFGRIKRASVTQNVESFKRSLNVYVVSENVDGTLAVTSDTIKQNLKTWITPKKAINDSIQIRDALIVNIGVNFTIVAAEDKNKYSAVLDGISALREFYKVNFDIGESFNIGNVYSILKTVPSILDVVSVDVTLKSGGNYSDTRFDINRMLTPDGRFVTAPEGYIFEIKFLDVDLRGTVR